MQEFYVPLTARERLDDFTIKAKALQFGLSMPADTTTLMEKAKGIIEKKTLVAFDMSQVIA